MTELRLALGVLVGAGAMIAAQGCSSREGPGDTTCTTCVDSGPMTVDSGPSADSGPIETPDTGVVVTDAGQETDSGPDEVPDATVPSTAFFVMSEVKGAGRTGNVAAGFNIDGRVSTTTDNESCRKMDYTSPAPDNEAGVDNQLGPMTVTYESNLMLNGNIATSIETGALLVLVELTGLDDWQNDDDITVDVLFGRATAAIELDTDDLLEAGQTFDIDANSYEDDGVTPLFRFENSSIVDGRVRTGVGDFTVSWPYMTQTLELNLQTAQLRFDLAADEISTGVLGGALNVDEFIPMISMFVDPSFRSFVDTLIRTNADLLPVDGECSQISVGMTFKGVPAVKGSILSSTTP